MRELSLEEVETLLKEGVAYAQSIGRPSSMVVVDFGGHVRGALRPEKGRIANVPIAEKKAWTAVVFQRPTDMVRDVMVRDFPTVKHSDNVTEIVRVAQDHAHFESLPVMNDDGKMIGIIRAEDLHRVLDSDMPPQLVNASDIALAAPLSVSPNENLLEALRDFGTRDIETLPVEAGRPGNKVLIGLLMRSDVMQKYREEMLRGA